MQEHKNIEPLNTKKMKLKSFVLTLAALSLSLSACAHDQLITFQQLPAPSQAIINAHFNPADISVVIMDKDLVDTDYEVRFTNGTKIEFDGDGSLDKIDCGLQPVPSALIPDPVKQYVSAQFPNVYITEWKRDDWHWKAELSNRLELIFNRNYEYVGIDD